MSNKRWLFVAQLRGTYTCTDGEKEFTSPSLYLGVQTGEDPETAFAILYGRHGLEINLPDISKAKIWAYEVPGQGIDVNFNKVKCKDDEAEALARTKTSKVKFGKPKKEPPETKKEPVKKPSGTKTEQVLQEKEKPPVEETKVVVKPSKKASSIMASF